MRVIDASKTGILVLGYQGESQRVMVRLPLVDERNGRNVAEEFPGGQFSLSVTFPNRPGEYIVSPSDYQVTGNWIEWEVKAAYTQFFGEGNLQINYSGFDSTGMVKSKVWRITNKKSISTGAGTVPDWSDWKTELLSAAADVQSAVESYDAMTATAEGLPAGSTPTAEIDRSGENPVLRLGIPAGQGGGVTVDSELSESSTNPVQNKVIAGALSSQSETIANLPSEDDSDASGPDLDISDEDGNVLVRMKNGQIQTKEFDSAKAPALSGSSGQADFDLSDENGNVLLRMKNGNIYTKNLDSGALNDDFYFGCENRLANPLYETFEHYNTENSESPIEREVALSRNMLDPTAAEYRIPGVAITNAGTIIVCGQRMKNPIGDYGDFGIDISRKEVGGSWEASVLIPFDSTRESYGHTENVSILVDRNNDRIYVFYGTFLDNVVWWEETTAGCDYKYVYSDDDGETWSEPVSLKNKWDTTKYKLCIPSCSQGIVLTDGTFVVPSMCVISTNPNTSSPVILYKTPNGDWTFSDIVQIPGVVMMDECAVVEGSNNQIRLYCRPNYSYMKGANRSYHEFVYNISRNTFTQIPSTFNANRGNFMGIDAITLNNKKIYLMSFTDTHGDVRENGTLWASLDGQKWIRVFRYLKESSAGYSVLTNYNGQLVVAFEYQSTYGGAIAVEDLTDLFELIEDSAALIDRNISVQDHIQMLYNAVNGIE